MGSCTPHASERGGARAAGVCAGSELRPFRISVAQQKVGVLREAHGTQVNQLLDASTAAIVLFQAHSENRGRRGHLGAAVVEVDNMRRIRLRHNRPRT